MERTTQIQLQLSLTLQCFKDIVEFVQTEIPQANTPEFYQMLNMQVKALKRYQNEYKGMPESMFNEIMEGLI